MIHIAYYMSEIRFHQLLFPSSATTTVFLMGFIVQFSQTVILMYMDHIIWCGRSNFCKPK